MAIDAMPGRRYSRRGGAGRGAGGGGRRGSALAPLLRELQTTSMVRFTTQSFSWEGGGGATGSWAGWGILPEGGVSVRDLEKELKLHGSWRINKIVGNQCYFHLRCNDFDLSYGQAGQDQTALRALAR